MNQVYTTDASKEYVILGNSALVKCVIPSFVADLVSIVNWEDDRGQTFTQGAYGIVLLPKLKLPLSMSTLTTAHNFVYAIMILCL